MLVIDPYKTWQTLAERLETEKNPLHRRQLEKIIAHMKGEAAGDIDQILTTVSPKASYISYDNPSGPPRVFKGHEGAPRGGRLLRRYRGRNQERHERLGAGCHGNTG
jgi:hypothetical protein